jgi:putative transposase
MLRLLNIVDEFTREALVMHVGRSTTAEQTVTVLQALVAERGCPENIRCDNEPELTAHALRDWCTSTSVTTSYMSRARRGRTRSRNPSTLVSVTSC